jgi:hypothetical protein
LGAVDTREALIADSQFGGGATTWAPATWFLALSTTTPAGDGSGFTEPSVGAYARLSLTNNATNFPAAVTVASTTTKTNGVAFTMANPTANWGLITYFGFFVASSGGTVQYWFKLDANITVNNGNTPVQFDPGQLIMTWGATS